MIIKNKGESRKERRIESKSETLAPDDGENILISTYQNKNLPYLLIYCYSAPADVGVNIVYA